MLLDGGIGVLFIILEAYMGEAVLPAEPIQGRKTWPLWALVQCGGIIPEYASGCCSFATSMR